MSQSFHRRHRGAIAFLAALLALGASSVAGAASAFDGMRASPVWGNFQYGLTVLQRHGEAMETIEKDSEYWKLEAGMRVTGEWMAGIGAQGISLRSYDKLTQLYGTVVFNPKRGPWLYQAALGTAKYAVNFSGNDFDEKYSGLGAQLGMGWDWTPSGLDDVHIGARLTYEYSWLGEREGGGSLDHSRVSLGLSMSFY